ncbi:TetR/AcrR family transcriptional regulator [Pseudomonas sp. BN414]|nr:TetR/AcrR family transcriptional regulator [Pseudomonas sp. BN414]MDH4580816.1 TetR/AcrR family transcriptional regulator [Pseudomonas sp. BN415]
MICDNNIAGDRMAPSESWRKKPQQARSRLTVEAILHAAEALFVTHGYEATTLERIAEKAGVGIGSVYDYFTNKHAIALTLYELTSQQAALDSRKLLIDPGIEDIETNLPKIIRGVYQCYRDHQSILIDLVDEVVELRAAEAYSFERLIYRASFMYLQIYEDRFAQHDLQSAHAYLMLMVTSTIKQYIKSAPTQLSEEDFLAHLSRTILSHLLAEPPSPLLLRH